jgi:hypothetical protein
VRKLLIGALMGALMLAVAAIALADTQTTFDQKYTSAKKSTSVGTKFSTTSKEDGNAENNHQPKSTREFDVTFPAGSKFDQKAVPFCKNLDEAADNPCPKNTKVGSGSADALLPNPGLPPIPSDVTAYNRKGGLWLFVQPQVQGQAPVILKPNLKGLKLKTHIEPLCVASTNQDGQCVNNDGSAGKEVVLTRFELTTKAVKKGKHTFLKTPPTCTKKGWAFAADLTYADGTKGHFTANQKCKK